MGFSTVRVQVTVRIARRLIANKIVRLIVRIIKFGLVSARRIVPHRALCVARLTAFAFAIGKDFVFLANSSKVMSRSGSHSPLPYDRKVAVADLERRSGAGNCGTGVACINLIGTAIPGSICVGVTYYWYPGTDAVREGISSMPITVVAFVRVVPDVL